MAFIQETAHERALRRLQSCTYTLYSVADEIRETESIEERGDLLIAVENLIDVATFVTDAYRGIAWQHTPNFDDLESDTD